MIKLCALIVGGTYAYRRFTEGTAEELKASNRIAPLGQFVVAWSVVFLGLSLLAPASPTLASNMALLVALASVLANGSQIAADLRTGLRAPQAEREAAAAQKRQRSHPSSTRENPLHFEPRSA